MRFLSKPMKRKWSNVVNVTYGVIAETYSSESSTRKSYGIAAYSNSYKDGTATIVAAIHDITTDIRQLTELVSLCNSLELSLCHLNDVVEDFVAYIASK